MGNERKRDIVYALDAKSGEVASELAIMRVGGQGAIADTIPGF